MVAQFPAPDDEACRPVPSGRHARGRHRRPKNHGGPAYLTAATLTAFTVGGVNVPNALGDARQASSTSVAAAVTTSALQSNVSAKDLRRSLAEQQERRASRLRRGMASAVQLGLRAAEQEEAEAEARRPKWVLPVQRFRLTAGFGDVSGLWSSSHTGQDFATPYGYPVRAVGDGEIISAGWDGSYGNKLAIRHEDGTVTWYAHLSSFERTSGQVKAGDLVARVGSTGNSTGNHLHLEVRPGGGDPIEPMTWLRRKGIRL